MAEKTRGGRVWSEEILATYAERGRGAYFGEPVTFTEHGLQAAYFAESCGASNPLVVAALLHDVGHLIGSAPEDLADWTSDAQHELTGSRWLAERFGADVCEPVRLHVAAKRYLCATDPAYVRRLSAASVRTLALQGGPMTPAEVVAFEAEPYHRDAVLLRQWDDQAKVTGLRVPDLPHYRPLVDGLAAAAAG